MQRTPLIVLGIALLAVLAVVAVLLMQPSTPAPGAGESSQASASASAAQPSASASLDAELLNRRWTVLYVGTDHNASREAAGEPVNTDALLLVSLSADQSRLTLVSLPRDTVDLPLADGSTYEHKINGLYREQGMDALVGAMEELYGVPIDAHVLLDMDDFASLVSALGGITVSPPEPLVDPKVDLDLAAGEQEIDGPTTLSYVRTRVDQDYGRMARQQEVVMALVSGLVDPEADIDLRTVLDGLDSLETDLPMEQLPTLIELARRATDAQVEKLVIGPPLITFEGDRGDGRGYVLEPDVEAIRDEVQGLIGEQ
jgi:LCP family protein required for cell wall assembly